MDKWLIDLKKTVAIYLDRSDTMLDIIYNCFEHHITYVPIDVSWPMTRVQQVLQDSRVRKVITERKYESLFLEYDCCLIEDKVTLNKLFSDVYDNDIGYVLYTSGSTGVPKGVAVYREAVLNLIEGVIDVINMSKNDTIACITSVSFDIFVVESILAKYIGMNVVMANNEEQSNPKLLVKLIRDNNVNIIQMTPSRMQLLLSYDRELKCLEKAKYIMLGGEAFPYNLLKILQSKTKAKIYNLYGPTETTVWSSISDLTEKDKIDIGFPIKNTEIFILDSEHKSVAVGEIGEICIAGKGLAKGYVGRPDLTRERFLKIKELGNQLVYRTGDSGRYLESGELECFGRLDNQIKLNGYRIELEEIEAHLCGCEGITQALVALESINDKQELVAYYISERGMDELSIRNYLKDHIPVYMIPSAYRRVKQFNYTSNGKIDRHDTTSLVYESAAVTIGEYELNDMRKDILHRLCSELTITVDEQSLMNMSFSDAGIDSIIYLGLIAKFEDIYDVMFDECALHGVNFYRISDFVDYCEKIISE